MEHTHTGETCFSVDEAKTALWDKDIDLAKEYADKVVVLRKGKIIFNGKPKEFSSEIM